MLIQSWHLLKSLKFAAWIQTEAGTKTLLFTLFYQV